MENHLIRKSVLLFSLLFVGSLFHAQTTSENYVQTKTYLEETTTSSASAKQIQTVQYLDGLGRPKQMVNVKASPTGKDVVNHIEYDAFGRQLKDYLPIPQSGTQNGDIYTSPLGNASTIYGSEKIYSEKVLENSPLDKVLQQVQIGNDWTNKPVNFEYGANTQGDNVKKYETTTTWDATNKIYTSDIQQTVYYTQGQLYKNTITDEDGNKTIEFKNGKGQVVLARKILSTSENADTYYVYNEYSQLAYVIPPLASVGTIDQTVLDNLCYRYKYDSRNRLVEKKLPGKGWEHMVYDKADRLIFTQDAILRSQGKWLFTKYDQFGRVIYTGIILAAPRPSLQNTASDYIVTDSRSSTGFTKNGMQVYYTNVLFNEIQTLLSVNYYDTYPSYSFNPSFPNTIYGKQVLTDSPATVGKSTKSLPVMTLVKNIEDDNWTKIYNYYDLKGRAIGSHSINHLGGYTKTESDLDFAGVPLQTKTYHKRLSSDTEKVITETFTYDNQNRVLTHKHRVDNNTEEILTQNTYNELSQLSNKKVGGTNTATPLQSVDYAYNIRGWMTKINDPANLTGKLFGYEMKYTNPIYNTVSSGKFNGNIAEIDWATSNNGTLKRYNYLYDALNRLKNGIYSEPNTSLPQNGYYNETVNYDLNGNILNLQRNRFLSGIGLQLMDNLSYLYIGNKLNTVTDATGSFGGYPESSGNQINYDLNGNMTDHIDKGVLQISYNYLNLPDYIKFDQTYIPRLPGVDENVNTQYLYRADGVKLKKVYTYGSGRAQTEVNRVTEYLDGFQYEGEHTSKNFDTALRFVPTAEGYYNFENNKYIYNYTDHLGNIRLSYLNNGLGAEIIEENNYYPFGLKQGTGGVTGNPVYRYQYNGKELQEETGMYDYGIRFYMPELGRWGIHDPLSGITLEPYGYAYNNPIFFNDPTGMIGEPGEPELAPNAPGGKNNPIEIPEVVLTKKSKSININNFGLYNPNSLNFGQWVQYQQASQRYQKVIEFQQSRANCGYCHDRGVMMIGGAGDPIGILDVGALLLSRMEPKNKYAAIGIGLAAILVTRSPNAVKMEASIARTEAYAGVKEASAYLQQAGVPRNYRKQILESFEIETISLRTADNSTYGLRFYGGTAKESGRYLFPTFNNYINRVGLALPPEWNTMSGFTQFKIAPGTPYVFGRAASQGGIYTGGSLQMYINDVKNLTK